LRWDLTVLPWGMFGTCFQREDEFWNLTKALFRSSYHREYMTLDSCDALHENYIDRGASNERGLAPFFVALAKRGLKSTPPGRRLGRHFNLLRPALISTESG